jgi:hypothetical protein
MTKAMRTRPITDSTVNGGTLNAFPARSGTRQGCQPPPLPFKMVTGEKKDINSIKVEKR